MRISVALTIVAALASAQAFGQSKENRTLTEAKAYTDTQVAEEATIRGNVDVDLQSDINGLTTQVSAIQTAVAGLSGTKTRTINLHAAAFGGSTNYTGERCIYGDYLYAALPVPEGAKVTSLKFSAKDLETTGFLSMALFKAPLVPTSRTFLLEGSTSGSGAPGLVSVTVFPRFAGDQLSTEEGHMYYAEFSPTSSTAGTLALCGLSVTYEEP